MMSRFQNRRVRISRSHSRSERDGTDLWMHRP
jgi:hypothetical protein